MISKREYLVKEFEQLGDRSSFYYEDFWIIRSPLGGYTVIGIKLRCVEHFSTALRVVDFLSRYDRNSQYVRLI